MRVNTAELKNNLSRYLRRIGQSNGALIVCERGRPVATLRPLKARRRQEDERQRQELLARARRLGVNLVLPTGAQKPMRMIALRPETAHDRQTRVPTIGWLRGGRSY